MIRQETIQLFRWKLFRCEWFNGSDDSDGSDGNGSMVQMIQMGQKGMIHKGRFMKKNDSEGETV